MKISILTLFPEMTTGVFQYSIIGRAIKQGLLEINAVNLRGFGLGKYKQVDDKPYGGGVGMIMRVDVIDKALQNLYRPRHSGLSRIISDVNDSGVAEFIPPSAGLPRMTKKHIILLDPKGKTYNQAIAKRLSKYDHLILICGHYEGVDHRVTKLVDESISIGDYILTGGEIPAMVIVDSVTRLLPGVFAKKEATKIESFSREKKLEFPQYTRPEEYNGMKVPKILLSGNHKKIEEWKKSLLK